MVEVRFADSAWQDLDAITDNIAQDSLRYSQDFANRIFQRVEILEKFQRSGRVVPEFQNEDIRELVMGGYRIVYRIYSDNLIIILRIVHGSKLLEGD